MGEKFLSSCNSFTPNLKFTYDSSKKDNHSYISKFQCKLSTDLNIKYSPVLTLFLGSSRAYETANCLSSVITC